MALSLSPLIRRGTSTWAYEGLQGQVYKRQYAKSAFTREWLESIASISTKESHSSEPWATTRPSTTRPFPINCRAS